MEGLEVSEVSLTEIAEENYSFRIDSEFVMKEYLLNQKTIKNYSLGFSQLGALSTEVTGGATPLGAAYLNSGVMFLRVQNIMPNYFNLNDVVYISYKDDNSLSRSRLKLNDVLLTITGVSYGKSAVVEQSLVGCNINQHSVRIKLKKGLNPYFLSTFLNSKHGKLQSDKNVVGVTRPALDYPSIRNFYVPNISTLFQNKIEMLVKQAYQVQDRSNTFYQKAETMLLAELGIKDWHPVTETVEVKSFADSFGTSERLDSEFYQPKFRELEDKLRATKKDVTLGSVLTFCQRGTQPIYVEERGTIVLNSKHVRENKIQFTDNRIASLAETRPDLIIRKGDVLMNGTGVGTIGRAAAYLSDNNALPDNHVTILRSKTIDPVFLALQLNSIVGKLQVEKYYKGSSGQIELYPDDIKQFMIWQAPDETQKKVRETIESAQEQSKQSKQLLGIAQRAIELAIETSENEAQIWLDKQI
ncbi:restriction endonuclease subunit S domain-containing protein [Spirosoma radiotolerans]|uniref:restriction endonuclease subunit S n=1 Tax=Spirosoma radiotolerans TaxID=1379870 RepID=UPI00061CE820|nr:restriction endonuclease subunit S [Spirosoma radiotolerans]